MKAIFGTIRGSMAAGLLTLALAAGVAGAAGMPKVGDAAPAFTAQDQDGKELKLADFAGQKYVLLYFYPKDETPGCTKQACTWRDSMDDFKAAGVEVIGVSFDTAEAHKSFIANHKLNFRLIPDPDGKLADQYGVRLPNRPMADRVSFLIGKDGKVINVIKERKADLHVTTVKDAIAKLKK